MWNALKSFGNDIRAVWRVHGTKILAVVSALFGSLAVVNEDLLKTALGEKWAAIVLIVGGIAAYVRGLGNTARADRADQAPPPPPAQGQ